MAKKGEGYLKLGWLVSVILAIIPITNIIFGVIARVQKKNILGIVLNILLCPLFWIIDLITIITQGKVTVLC